MMGPTSVAPELTSMASTARASRPRSGTINGAKRLTPARSVRWEPNALVVSSLYFIDIRAPLRIVDLDVFRRRLHQLRMGAGGEHLAFHQDNDLVVVLDGGDFLRDRNQSNAGVLLVNIF